MKGLAVTVSLCCATLMGGALMAQSGLASDAGPRIVLRPTIPAYFPGCGHEPEGTDEKTACSGAKVMSYIASNLRYPDEAREEKIEGVVVLSFVVTSAGDIEQVRILRDIGGGCGAEAARIVNDMPTWQPAFNKGSAVYTQFTLPITFNLKTGMFDYVLHLGELTEGELDRKELIATVTSVEPRVTDPKGKELLVAEVIYTFERGGQRRELITRGVVAPNEKEFSKFIGRKPGRLTVEANAVEELDIKAVSKAFVIVR